ncbi:putative nucleic-acid-binding Zn-ribbon protein OS=Ureibacillus acetophenoni OX=614649 GN=SAMN05877842_106165 PE=4 SV=1 [Ureibacillus acetophenoni]|uniref:hypothetical protein n=1 Tax=Ureibacillus sp. MALMAid1270 TaxID=3411629 RepID=UPI003BA72181
MFSKKELERMRLEGEKIAQEMQKEKEEKEIGSEYKAGEIEVSCIHCKHNKFEQGKAMLNTRGLTFLDLEWLNDEVTTLLCKRCGFIHWFGSEVVKMESK